MIRTFGWRGASRLDAALTVVMLVLGAGFVIVWSARPVVILSNAGLDDALFMHLGQSIAAGRWLDHYDQRTLVKGIGFPLFLALSNLIGTPFGLSMALFHVTCCGFASRVFGGVMRSSISGAVLFVLIIFAPEFYFADLLRVFRDFFYTSLTIALFASATALAVGRPIRPAVSAPLTGVLGGWWWLTREEGVWMVPCFGILALLLVLRVLSSREDRPSLREWRRIGAPVAISLVIAGAIVGMTGLVNLATYGRFVVNEVKDPAFAGAMSALQSAGAPFSHDKVAVPKAARARIYAVSPTFATLRTPILDGPMSAQYAADGCRSDPRICGDIGGGWFLWVLREAAAAAGQHESPKKAAAFYSRIAREVTQACADGRLKCQKAQVPLAPPMKGGQIADLIASARRVIVAMTFHEPVWTDGVQSDLSAPDAETMYAFLNRPTTTDLSTKRAIAGWFVDKDANWLEVEPLDGVKIAAFDRQASPDLPIHFHNPQLGRQRFVLRADCPPSRCPILFKLSDGETFPADLASLSAGPRALGKAEIFVDAASNSEPPNYLKSKVSRNWVRFAASLNGLYRLVLVAGVISFGLIALRDAVRRRPSAPLVICLALSSAVAARIFIVALIDALSFPAANPVYVLPAVPLLLIASVVAGTEALRTVSAWAGSRLNGNKPAEDGVTTPGSESAGQAEATAAR